MRYALEFILTLTTALFIVIVGWAAFKGQTIAATIYTCNC